jgi:hypothetical protein
MNLKNAPSRQDILRCSRSESAMGMRRGRAALSSGCKPHPATAPGGSNRSSHGGDEVVVRPLWPRPLSVLVSKSTDVAI